MQRKATIPPAPLNAPANSDDRLAEPASARRAVSAAAVPALVVPRGSRLTSSVTYSDLQHGYRGVERQPELLRVPEGSNVRVVKRQVHFVGDPDSIAIILATPTRRPGAMKAAFGITHRKLRYLFNDAISWSLMRDRLRFQEGAVAMYTATSAFDVGDDVLAMLPPELTTVEVHANDLNCDAPTVQFVNPKGFIHWLFYGVLAVLAGFLFVEALTFSRGVVLQATTSAAYRDAVYTTARELRTAMVDLHAIALSIRRAVSKEVVRVGLHAVAFFQDIQNVHI